MKTRAKKAAPSKGTDKNTTAPATATVKTLDPPEANPPHVFILPENLSSNARIITCPNPATSAPCRFLICPQRGCYEFTRVAAPKKSCRSWLLAPDRTASPDVANEAYTGASDVAPDGDEGYVLQNPDLMLATPIDPLFLILPALVQDALDGGRQFYLAISDYVERLAETSPHFKEMTRSDESRCVERLFESRIAEVCTSMHDGTETLYMLSNQKLLDVITRKAERMVETGLPASMEEHFVKQALAVPVLSIRREESGVSIVADPGNDTPARAVNEVASSEDLSQDTQTSSISASTISTAATSASSTSLSPETSGEIIHLLRLRTAINFILRSYIPSSLDNTLTSLLEQNASPRISFTILNDHLAHLAKLKQEAQTLRSLSDNISRKRSAIDDEDGEALERADAKKRKKEEEDLKKKSISRGVKQLEKADRSGMKTLSSFFAKAPLQAKKKT